MGTLKTFIRTRLAPLYALGRKLRHAQLGRRSPETVFSEMYLEKKGARPGQGSSLVQTEAVRRGLMKLLEELQVKELLDIPCGDFFRLRMAVMHCDYTGGDIVAELVAEDQRLYRDPRHRFRKLDIITDPLPRADLLLNRDCLPYFSFAHALQALANIKRSGTPWLLTTTFTQREENEDVPTGAWRPLNLERPPFNFPPPVQSIDEQCPEPGFRDKHLALWSVADLP